MVVDVCLSSSRIIALTYDLRFAVDPKHYYGASFVSEEGFEEFGDQRVRPGGERDLDFWVRAAATDIMPQLEVGSAFQMMEGLHPVADGIVTEVYRVNE